MAVTGTVDTAEHSGFVGDALATFRHSRVLDEATEACFERVRDLAKQHFPDVDAYTRMERTFRVMAEVIETLEVGAARARAVYDQMEAMYVEACAVAGR